jgi:Protein of unknown function (DUF1592)/Protein of unknown function (DUF1588)/Protein of unknown function (DUF1587)/Protein of unknown function (DUF1595)/Protein of unknown function (DUF1585)/Ca-dependent carbohydrate-binding module xylan-binding
MKRALTFGLTVLVGCSGQLFGGEKGSGPGGTGGPGSSPLPPGVTPTPSACLNKARPTGKATIRRLNRYEYNNTVRDLVGDTSAPASAFPADDFGGNFDNQGDVLSTAPLLVEKYAAAAEKLAASAVVSKGSSGGFDKTVAGKDLTGSTGQVAGSDYNLYSNGTVQTVISGMADGKHTFTVNARETPAGSERSEMVLSVDGKELSRVRVAQASKAYAVDVQLTAGNHTFVAEFTNDFYDMTTKADRNLLVESFRVTRPAAAGGGTGGVVLSCDPATGATCVDTILKNFGRKAFRRPLSDEELTQYKGVVATGAEGATATDGIRLAIEAMLLSPQFLFRAERNVGKGERALDDYELASRLSYFIWGTMPDDKLSALADSGGLRAAVATEVKRMQADPKASALVTQFAGSWLWSRSVDGKSPDTKLFPTVTADLKRNMREETEAFIRTFVQADRDITEILSSDDAYLNDALAKHYGAPVPGSNTITRVSPAPANRGGLLTQAGTLMVTSHPATNSPVLRGKFVLAQLLCQEPLPPPADVPSLVEPTTPTGTLRERLIAHQSKPVCKSCHKNMDPIGFALENFDPVGQWRTTEAGGFAVDASTKLWPDSPQEKAINGPKELAAALKDDGAFKHCMATQLFTYAVGRAPTEADVCTVVDLEERLKAKNHFGDLMMAVIESAPFAQKLGE